MNDNIIYNKEKFKDMLHYIIYNCDDKQVGRTVLYKLLYFSDFDFYEIYEKPISGMKYIHEKNGPTPIKNKFNQAIYELINEERIKVTTDKIIDYYKYKYQST